MFSHGASKKYSTSLWTLLDKDINKNEGLHIAGTFSVCDYGGSDCSKVMWIFNQLPRFALS